MKKYSHFITVILIVLIVGCNKTSVDNPYAEFSEPYTTGIIEFQYTTGTVINGTFLIKDTTITFTSIGNNLSEKDDYGYSKPSTPWLQLLRLNPNDFPNNAFLFFPGTDLDSLALPFTFKSSRDGGNINRNAQINYRVDLKQHIDSAGNVSDMIDTYAASTEVGNFTLTILSRKNNRLQGTFSGELKNQDGKISNAQNGLFDVVIVDK